MYQPRIIPQAIYDAASKYDVWSIAQGYQEPSQSVYVPTVIRKTPTGERAFDIFSAFLEENAVFLESAIDQSVATNVSNQLLYLATQSDKKVKEINLYISSPGGSVPAGLQILDTMSYIETVHSVTVNTICTGIAMSMGAFLLAAGTGRRMAFPNASIMIHQPLSRGGGGGQATEMEIGNKYMQDIKKLLTCYLALHTGKKVKRVLNDCERDNFMTAEEAQAYGIIDQIYEIGRRQELAPLFAEYDAAHEKMVAARKSVPDTDD
jgi:ATP-dependent Clp protease protease subunit